MIKVHLRSKNIKNGMTSLYLDFYPPLVRPDTLKPTRREFLKMHIYTNPKGQLQKQHNSETMATAKAIESQRQVDIQNEFYGFISSKGKSITIIEYFEELAKKRIEKENNWQSALHHVKRFFGAKNIKLSEITIGHCNQFREFLLIANSVKSPDVKIHNNTALSYFNKFKATLKQAYKEGLIKHDINARIDRIKETDTIKEYLTIEELKLLKNTDCKNKILKTAALFSAMSGLRFCDLLRLKWGDIRFGAETRNAIHYRQSKTKGVEVLPISDEAVSVLGERKSDDQKIFTGLKYSIYTSIYVRKWINDAKINKDITFHCFRHTFATMQLTLGTDIYTLSKMMGHKNVSTTQVYAKVVDKRKIEAANRISLM